MAEPDERWLNDANVIRLLLGALGFCIGAWLLSQQLSINSMTADLKVIEVNTAGLGDLKHDVGRLRDAHEDDAKAFAALKVEADDTKSNLEKSLTAKQMNLLKKDFRRKQDASTALMQKQEQHYKREIARDDETIRRQAAER